ncbi:MAG: coproporphyrinogen III oxidase [Rhodospirillaceae bacterium]|jgi:putative oxygen-independent coproporphyrinogen III oxidase|nr:coproporphyrinogen III oxidase [Rhodospirillaceae bacterium]MBT5243018.1 coproporphyrinogen III oxidase [Rhodospirillaceae bacterium]MBT5563243.1 coproporphyrinogen III oxidase [Rhodospirillaceae bacterium]MBT6243557.1 coproporphyrinogen III oxidase [Rhodospirillaceae bacterium]
MIQGLSLYIHWPFCLSKCPYCDFNSHVSVGPVDEERWRRALLAEMAHFAAETRQNRLETVFFGGGTPSTMAPATTAALISAAKGFWTCSETLEITLEANPTSVEAGKLADFANAGVNRLSLGVQSFNDKSLKFLGREHSANDAMKAISLASERFERFSFDLIYGLPGQQTADWKNELNQALELAGGHLSLYQLSIEEGTPFFCDGVAEADSESGADFYELTHEQMALKGFNAYEISNYALENQECRHNLAIWRGGDYVGIGPGAHGRLSGSAATDALYQIHDPARWLERVDKDGHATAKRHTLSAASRAEELLLTGLRLSQGIDGERFSRVRAIIDENALQRLIEAEFLICDENGLCTTQKGRLCLNAVLAELLA